MSAAEAREPLLGREEDGEVRVVTVRDHTQMDRGAAARPWSPSFAGAAAIVVSCLVCRTWLPLSVGHSRFGSEHLSYNVGLVVALAESFRCCLCAAALPVHACYFTSAGAARDKFRRLDCKTFLLYSVPAICHQTSKSVRSSFCVGLSAVYCVLFAPASIRFVRPSATDNSMPSLQNSYASNFYLTLPVFCGFT